MRSPITTTALSSCSHFAATHGEVPLHYQEKGGIVVFEDFPFIDTVEPNGTPSTNFVRVEGGEI